MNLFKYIVLFLLYIITLSANTNLQLTDNEKEYLKNNPIIKVHNEMNWAPYNYNMDGKPLGYSIEYMKLLASKVNMKVEFISGYSWNQFIDKIKNNDIDVMLNIAKTDKRKKFLAYTSEYHKGIDAVFTKNNATYDNLNDFNGKTIAVVKGFYEEELLRNFYPNIKVITAKNSLDAMKLVSFGKADGSIDNLASGNYIISQHQLTHLKPNFEIADERFNLPLYIATNKNNIILRNILEKAKQQITEEEAQSVTNLWLLSNFKYKNNQSNLSLLEKEYLLKKKKIKLCVMPNNMPYERIDKNNKHIGMSSEFIEIIEKKIGVDIELLPTKTWAKSLQNIKQRKCDMLSVAIETPSRKSFLNFTKPYIIHPLVIATTYDKPFIENGLDLGSHKIGVVKSYAFIEKLKLKYPNINIVEVSSTVDGLNKVRDRKIYGFLDSSTNIGYFMQQVSMADLKIAGKLDEDMSVSVSMASRNDEPLLNNILQKAIDSIDNAKRKVILNKWITFKYEKVTDYTLVWQILIVVFIIILVFIFWNRKLSKLNKQLEKTKKELELLASTDSMTKLYNRRYFLEMAESILDLDERNKADTSIIMLDIDKFKNINDTYGHSIGDNVIITLSNILQEYSRKSDIVCRWGGEEFVILLPNTNTDGAFIISQKIRKVIEDMAIDLNDNKILKFTASFGISQVKYKIDNDIDCAILRADHALYEAKESGRNKVCLNIN